MQKTDSSKSDSTNLWETRYLSANKKSTYPSIFSRDVTP